MPSCSVDDMFRACYLVEDQSAREDSSSSFFLGLLHYICSGQQIGENLI